MNFIGTSGYIISLAVMITAYASVIVGLFFIWHWFFEYVLKQVMQRLKVYQIFIEFIWDRSRYKGDKENNQNT